MEHPLFRNSRTFYIYFSMWMMITMIHMVIFIFFLHMPVSVAFADSGLYNLGYFFIGIALWYPVRYTQPSRSTMFNLLMSHLTAATLVVLAWSAFTPALIKVLVSNSFYLILLNTSFPWRVIIGVFYYSIIILFYYLIINYNDLQEKLASENRLKEMIKEGELNMLKAQINPHFLFNSLNSISSLTMTDPEKAQAMIISLSDFLRYSVSSGKEPFSTFGKETANIKRYLDIEKIRFGSRLIDEWQCDETCGLQPIPQMILQPLYENAIKHGVYESTGTVKISTTCSIENNFMKITIQNNFDPEARPRKGAGIGLKNIRERMRLHYQDDQLLQTRMEGDVFTAELKIPV